MFVIIKNNYFLAFRAILSCFSLPAFVYVNVCFFTIIKKIFFLFT